MLPLLQPSKQDSVPFSPSSFAFSPSPHVCLTLGRRQTCPQPNQCSFTDKLCLTCDSISSDIGRRARQTASRSVWEDVVSMCALGIDRALCQPARHEGKGRQCSAVLVQKLGRVRRRRGEMRGGGRVCGDCFVSCFVYVVSYLPRNNVSRAF
jgi:hypothetical protein